MAAMHMKDGTMSSFGNGIHNAAGPGSAAEPSMEEILASIRRILKEDETTSRPATGPRPDEREDLLVLDGSMITSDEAEAAKTAARESFIEAAMRDEPEVVHFTSNPAFFADPPPATAEEEAELVLFSDEPEEELVLTSDEPEPELVLTSDEPEEELLLSAAEPDEELLLSSPEPDEELLLSSPEPDEELVLVPAAPEPVLAAPEPEPAPVSRGKGAKTKRATMPEDDDTAPLSVPEPPTSMIIMVGPDTTPLAPKFVEPPPAPLLPEPTSMVIMVGPHETQAPPLTMEPAPMPAAAPTDSSILDDQMTSALSSSIGSAVRGATTERSTSVGRAGITLEDIVREEMKPVLKAWLEANLPEMVERVVRAEIERVVARLKG